MPPEKAPARGVVGQITRGTTNTNRLRRIDRWIARHPVLRRAADPFVVDLGYGASAVTVFELEAAARARAGVDVLGLEIDPARVERARTQLLDVRAGARRSRPTLTCPSPAAGSRCRRRRAPTCGAAGVQRAAAVRRARGEGCVGMTRRLHPDGILVEGTCDELGGSARGRDRRRRRATNAHAVVASERTRLAVDRRGALPKPSSTATCPVSRVVHDFLRTLDEEWTRAVGTASFGPVQRWRAALDAMHAAGWPVGGRARWRLGEVTVPWSLVAPV
jgi:hypothetical protein